MSTASIGAIQRGLIITVALIIVISTNVIIYQPHHKIERIAILVAINLCQPNVGIKTIERKGVSRYTIVCRNEAMFIDTLIEFKETEKDDSYELSRKPDKNPVKKLPLKKEKK